MTFAELARLPAGGFRVNIQTAGFGAIGSPGVVLVKRLIPCPERFAIGHGDVEERENMMPRLIVAFPSARHPDQWKIGILWADEVELLPKAPIMPRAEVETLLAALLLEAEEDGRDPAVYLRGEAF